MLAAISRRSYATLSKMTSRPLIVICGTTGVGKSKLGIELALALSSDRRQGTHTGARIINADSMQVYAGMDVITNKVPIEERCGVEHLLMDYKKPGEQVTGPEWIKDAISVIEETHERNQVPIVVGGTSYWIQHLLFPERMASLDKSGTSAGNGVPSEAYASALAALPLELLALLHDLPEAAPSADANPQICMSLHKLLTSLDPLVAQRWHWRDSRKVLTNLRIILDNARLASEIIREQSQTVSKPRYRTLCFWLYAKPDVLKPRLDERVDQMIAQGLLQEIQTLRAIASESTGSNTTTAPSGNTEFSEQVDYTLGIYQSIGYKEFHDYLSSPGSSEAAFREAVEQMKLGTRRYAKRQVAWIRNKLLPAVNAANAAAQAQAGPAIVPTYLLDATGQCLRSDPSIPAVGLTACSRAELGDAWQRNVLDVANRLTKAYLDGEVLEDPLTLSSTAAEMLAVRDRPTDPLAVLSANQRVVCEVCTVDPGQPIMVDSAKLEMHLRSRGHRRMTGRGKGGTRFCRPGSTEDATLRESEGIREQ
ncbi:IPP transferase-domain-containing protein [Daedaleopsis nitida]|nr:IPP transferase-domain-containing protein [Daedaleopsis nitida]